MKDIKISGRTERCFILKDDVAATVVIPISKLMPVDYRRLRSIEEKGGEMLQRMRDETLDNGRNALKQYESLFTVVRKESFEKKREESAVEEFDPEMVGKEPNNYETQKEEQPTKRGPGRPKKSSSKKTDSSDIV